MPSAVDDDVVDPADDAVNLDELTYYSQAIVVDTVESEEVVIGDEDEEEND